MQVTKVLMEPSYELFDHTADIGIRVFAATPAELLHPATEGLYAAVGELVPSGEAETASVDLTGDDEALLLRDYLTEVLMWMECSRRMVVAVGVEEFNARRLAATLETRPIDEERSSLDREVKAITYHQLAIERVANGYRATIIVDI